MAENKVRMEWLDAMRGFTMILVVAYHVAQMSFGQSEKTSASLPFLVLFRMPLFFFVSGFLAYKSKAIWTGEYFKSLVWKKIKVQVLPALIFLCAYIILRLGDFWNTFMKCMETPTKGGYWFTLALLYMFIIYYIFAFIEQKLFKAFPQINKEKWGWIPITVLFVLSLFVYETLYLPKCFTYFKDKFYMYSSLYQVMKFFHFFLMGNIVHRYWKQVQRLFDTKWFFPILLTTAFVCCADIFRWHTLRYGWTNLPRTLAMYTLMFTVIIFFRHYKQYFTKDTRLGNTLQYIGTRTLDIYLLHFFFLPKLPMVGTWLNEYRPNFCVDIVLSFSMAAIVIGFCLLTSNILRINPILKEYLFGRVEKKQ